MEIFNYSGVTGEYLGHDIARKSPNEENVFLIPAFSTPEAPPADVPAGKVAVFVMPDGVPPSDYNVGAWQIKSDFRGSYYSTVDGSPIFLSEIDVAPADRGLTALVPMENGKWSGKKWVLDAAKVNALKAADIKAQIAAIERDEQPAAQRQFVLDGDNTLMRAVQDKIDALTAQLGS